MSAELNASGPLLERAERHLRQVLSVAFEHRAERQALVVFDRRSELSDLLSRAYQRCLPEARFIEFDTLLPADILAALSELKPADLAVFVQSSSFRLEAYRLRVELFKRGIKVLEHPHLARMQGDEMRLYVEALAYDESYYRNVGHALRGRIDKARRCEVTSETASLIFEAGFESAKPNLGDYRGMLNVGGQFPIGEVFTESRDLEAVNGEVQIFAFADVNFEVNKPTLPITLLVERGLVVNALDATPAFDEVLSRISADEGVVWLRELGFGMNRAFSPERLVSDVGTFERMCGIHLSLGAKHNVFRKPGFSRREHRHHVDVFVNATAVTLDHDLVFADGSYLFER